MDTPHMCPLVLIISPLILPTLFQCTTPVTQQSDCTSDGADGRLLRLLYQSVGQG